MTKVTIVCVWFLACAISAKLILEGHEVLGSIGFFIALLRMPDSDKEGRPL